MLAFIPHAWDGIPNNLEFGSPIHQVSVQVLISAKSNSSTVPDWQDDKKLTEPIGEVTYLQQVQL